MKEKFVIVFGIFDTTARELVYFLSSPFFLLNGTPKSFSDSVSPAFLIRVGAAMEYSGSEEEVEEAKENIYEEIREKAEDNQLHNQQNQTDSRKSSTSSHEVSTTSSTGTTKSRFQKALEAVTRRSSRSLEHNNNNNNNNNNNSNNNNCNNNNSNNNNNRERSFHLSISKGRKKNLIDRARIDWDCDSQVIFTSNSPSL